MKKKKSLIAIVFIVLVIAIGVTYALLNSNTTFENLFNLADYKIVTTEVFESPSGWLPGDTVEKKVTARNNGTINAAVRVKLEEVWKDKNKENVLENVPDDAAIINFSDYVGRWEKDGDYYYYKFYLKPGEETVSLIDSVTLNSNLSGTVCTDTETGKSCTSNILNLNGSHYTLKFTIETVQYNKYQEIWNTNVDIVEKELIYSLSCGQSLDNPEIGTEVCFDGDTFECFYVIGNDEDNVTLISRYNLNVGKNTKAGTVGIQNKLSTGYDCNYDDSILDTSTPNSSLRIYPGAVPFSNLPYWSDENNNLLSTYGDSFPAIVYDSTKNGNPDDLDEGEIYSIAYYVNNYVNTLESYGANIVSSRLLLSSDLSDETFMCGNSPRTNVFYCPGASFLATGSFWMGQADNDSTVITFDSDTSISSYNIYNYDYGVRPVIVVSKDSINEHLSTSCLTFNRDNYPQGCGVYHEYIDPGTL